VTRGAELRSLSGDEVPAVAGASIPRKTTDNILHSLAVLVTTRTVSW
jgi:hypothetical protein